MMKRLIGIVSVIISVIGVGVLSSTTASAKSEKQMIKEIQSANWGHAYSDDAPWIGMDVEDKYFAGVSVTKDTSPRVKYFPKAARETYYYSKTKSIKIGSRMFKPSRAYVYSYMPKHQKDAMANPTGKRDMYTIYNWKTPEISLNQVQYYTYHNKEISTYNPWCGLATGCAVYNGMPIKVKDNSGKWHAAWIFESVANKSPHFRYDILYRKYYKNLPHHVYLPERNNYFGAYKPTEQLSIWFDRKTTVSQIKQLNRHRNDYKSDNLQKGGEDDIRQLFKIYGLSQYADQIG